MDDQDHNAPRHPGRILLERVMQPLGISRNQLARDIDVPVGRISDITNGKRGITADTALRLGRYFGMPPDLWLRLQAEFELHVVRTTTWRDIAPRVRVLESGKGPLPPRAPVARAAEIAPERPSATSTMLPDVPEPAPSPTAPESVTDDALGIPPRPKDWND